MVFEAVGVCVLPHYLFSLATNYYYFGVEGWKFSGHLKSNNLRSYSCLWSTYQGSDNIFGLILVNIATLVTCGLQLLTRNYLSKKKKNYGSILATSGLRCNFL
ncbi:hypothetical protein I3842_01G207500 [Carya illinoinensis]|uniref:Uncharacterized protein n=1 Tax=Carya illinoinensis TaxID=32201 RepID=A0A922G2U5_CARIL|nr:hypothetical protein I3842_01G207500 [Carya illinoinensis]